MRSRKTMLLNAVFLHGALFLAASLFQEMAIAQEMTAAHADPPEIAAGAETTITVTFANRQASQDTTGVSTWRCGLAVNFGDGTSEFVRVEDKQAPLKLTRRYTNPGNYAVTLEGRLQFQGFNTVFACGGETRSVAIVVRPGDFAAKEAAERAAERQALEKASADRAAAEAEGRKAADERRAAERARQREAEARAAAEKRAAKPAASPRVEPAKPSAPTVPASKPPGTAEAAKAADPPKKPDPIRAKSAMDL